MELNNEQCNLAFGGLPLAYKQWIIKMTLELDKAVTKHPDYPNGNHIYMAAIVTEESGELMKAAIDYVEQKGHYFDMHHEAIQTASSCLRMLLNLPDIDLTSKKNGNDSREYFEKLPLLPEDMGSK